MSSDNPIEQNKSSITLGRLKENIDEALAKNPSWEDKKSMLTASPFAEP